MIRLEQTVDITAPVERVFDLTRSIDFHVASSGSIAARAVGGRDTGLAELGDETTWSARYFGLRFRVRTRVTGMSRPWSFREQRVAGIPRRFEHTYTFEPLPDGRTHMTDLFLFESPLGPFGALVDGWLLRPKLQAAQRARCGRIKHAAETEEWRRFLKADERLANG